MPDAAAARKPATALDRFLNGIERAGNRLPDPAILFVILLLIVWVASALLAPVQFTEIDPRSKMPIRVQNLLTGEAIAAFLSNMVNVFVTFPPLGIVLVALAAAARRRQHSSRRRARIWCRTHPGSRGADADSPAANHVRPDVVAAALGRGGRNCDLA